MIINKADKLVLALESELARCDSATDSLLANTSRIQGRYVETLNTVPVKAENGNKIFIYLKYIRGLCFSAHPIPQETTPRNIGLLFSTQISGPPESPRQASFKPFSYPAQRCISLDTDTPTSLYHSAHV